MIFTFLVFPILVGALAFIIFAYIILATYKFIAYIFQSFGLVNIAKTENYKNPYIAWIPGISYYILGKFALENENKAIVLSILTIIKLILIILCMFVKNNILSCLSIIFIIVYFVIDMIVMNKFYKKVYKNSEIFTIFTIITLGILKPIFIYTAKIKKISKYEIKS